MNLRLYNTLTRTKEEFSPIDPNNVRMYVCGPTVYDFAHIGNARPVIVFDVLFRLLRHLYGADHVKYVRNITDVDDKINARALRDFPNLPLNEAIRNVTEKTANQFKSDAKALGCLEPTEEPRATDNIQGMIEMIQQLLNLNVAYIARGSEGREALFDVKMMKDYGKLSGRKLKEQKAGARIAIENHKRNPEDFVLWKESQDNEPGWSATFTVSLENQRDLQLNAPVKEIAIFGRPGWHIECSAMSKRYLGEVFDLHGGGLDLIFPHHENEIAQSRCAHSSDVMANVWMHNGFLQVEGQKMSKSLGNFVTIADLLETEKFGGKKWLGDILRFNMLRTHYRQPIDWTLRSLETSLHLLDDLSIAAFKHPVSAKPNQYVEAALCDDLNTPDVVTSLYSIRKQIALAGEGPKAIELAENLEFLGFNLKTFNDWKATLAAQVLSHFAGIDESQVQHLITARLVARVAKNWNESDRIRDELDTMGVAIKDNKDGTTTWEVKR